MRRCPRERRYSAAVTPPVKLVAPMVMHSVSPTRRGSTTTTGKPASSNALSDVWEASAVIRMAPARADLSSPWGLINEESGLSTRPITTSNPSAAAEEVRELMAAMGYRTFDEMIGQM